MSNANTSCAGYESRVQHKIPAEKMFAPSGVDSDSSGETPTPPTSPVSPRPQFSFRSLLPTLPSRRKKFKTTGAETLTMNEAVEKLKKLTPVEAADEFGGPRPGNKGEVKKKKKVRIVVDGETADGEDEVVMATEGEDVRLEAAEVGKAQDSESTISLVSPGAKGEDDNGRRPEDVAGEVLTVLRELMAESTASRQAAGSQDEGKDPNTAPISPYRSPATRFGNFFKLNPPPSRLEKGKPSGHQSDTATPSAPKTNDSPAPQQEGQPIIGHSKHGHGAAAEYYKTFAKNDLRDKLVVQNPTEQEPHPTSNSNVADNTDSQATFRASTMQSPGGGVRPPDDGRNPQPWSAPPHFVHQYHSTPSEHVPGCLCSPGHAPTVQQNSQGPSFHIPQWLSTSYEPISHPSQQFYHTQTHQSPLYSYPTDQISPLYHPGQFNPALWRRYQQNQPNTAPVSNLPSQTSGRDPAGHTSQQQAYHPVPPLHPHSPNYYPTYDIPSTHGQQQQHQGSPTMYPSNRGILAPSPQVPASGQLIIPEKDWSPSSLTHPRTPTPLYPSYSIDMTRNAEKSHANGLQLEIAPVSPQTSKITSPSRLPGSMKGEVDIITQDHLTQAISEKEPLKSPRIVMKGPDGWKEVDPKVVQAEEERSPDVLEPGNDKERYAVRRKQKNESLPVPENERVAKRGDEPGRSEARRRKNTSPPGEDGQRIPDDQHRRVELAKIRAEKERSPAMPKDPSSRHRVEKSTRPLESDHIPARAQLPIGRVQEKLAREERYAAEYKLKKMEYLRREQEKAKAKAGTVEAMAQVSAGQIKEAAQGKTEKVAPFRLAEPLPLNEGRSRARNRETETAHEGVTDSSNPADIVVALNQASSSGATEISNATVSAKDEKYVEEYKRRRMEQLIREKEKAKLTTVVAEGSLNPTEVDLAVRLAVKERETESRDGERRGKALSAREKVEMQSEGGDRRGRRKDKDELQARRARHDGQERMRERKSSSAAPARQGEVKCTRQGESREIEKRSRGADGEVKQKGESKQQGESILERAERKLKLLAAQEAERLELQGPTDSRTFGRQRGAAAEAKVKHEDNALRNEDNRRVAKTEDAVGAARCGNSPESARNTERGELDKAETTSMRKQPDKSRTVGPRAGTEEGSRRNVSDARRDRKRDVPKIYPLTVSKDPSPTVKIPRNGRHDEEAEPLDMDILDQVLAEDEAKHRAWTKAKRQQASVAGNGTAPKKSGVAPDRVSMPQTDEKEKRARRQEEERSRLENHKSQLEKRASKSEKLSGADPLATQSVPPEARPPESTEPRPQQGTGNVRPRLSDQSSPITWSKTLVSLATCIDLANELVSHLVASRSKDRARNSQQSPILVEVLPSLLTGLLMQGDLITSMKGAFGEEHSQSMDEFAKHLNLIKSFLATRKEIEPHQADAEDLKKKDRSFNTIGTETSHAFQMGSIQAIIEHLLNLTRYLSPQIISTLKSTLEQWHREGFSLKSLIHAVTTIQRELKGIQNSPEVYDSPEAKSSPGATDILGISGILNQLSSLLSFDHLQQIPSSPLPQTSSGGHERHSLVSSPSQRNTNTAFPESSDNMRKSTDEQSHGLRERVANVIHRVGDRLERNDSSPQHTDDISSVHGLRLITEDDDDETLKDNPRPRSMRSRDTGQGGLEESAGLHANHQLHLPAVTEKFLGYTTEDSTGRNLETTHVRGKHDSIIVTPPGPAFDADTGSQTEHQHRRPSAWSSDSHYSNDESDGTVESDDDARELLAVADSGPAPVLEEQGSGSGGEKPSEEQVKKAKDLLLKPSPARIGRADNLVVIDEDIYIA